MISAETAEISQLPAYKIGFQSSEVRALGYHVKAGDHLLKIVCEAPPEQYEEYKTVFDKIAASFTFTR